MQVYLSRYIGFCPGVKRAIRMAEQTLAKPGEKVFTLGPIIHNPQVVRGLVEKGMEILPDDINQVKDLDIEGAHVIIRSHGISPQMENLLKDRGAILVDATCPTVKKAQKAASSLVQEGYKLFIIGSADHPEVKAILGRIAGDATVIKEPRELKEWWDRQQRKVRKVGIIAQTTVDLLMFRNLVDELINEIPELIREVLEIKIINTLCRNTLSRQAEALRLSLSSDFVVVMGGVNSSNTEFLRLICSSTGTPTLKIETASELDISLLKDAQRVAIIGGASTPFWIVEEAVKKITRYFPEAEVSAMSKG